MTQKTLGQGSSYHYAHSGRISYTSRDVDMEDFFLSPLQHFDVENQPLPMLALTASQGWERYNAGRHVPYFYPSDHELKKQLKKMVK